MLAEVWRALPPATATRQPGSCPQVAAHTTFLRQIFSAGPFPSQVGSGWGSVGPGQLALLPCQVRRGKQAQHGAMGPEVAGTVRAWRGPGGH